jgi:hypothetical protein
MSNELKKIEPDGFEGYEDRIEGDEARQGGGVIHGSVVKFSNEAAWVTRDGEELLPDLELIAVDIGRVVQKWKDQAPVETIILEPGQKYPDIEELNDKTPRSEWTEGPDGKPHGPWQAQHIVYLLNAATMDRYSFPTGTTGGAIAVRDLVDKTKWMRRFRGQHVYPVVTLSDTFMNTRFGGRQRPHFLIKRWVNLGPDEKVLPAPPTQKALDHLTMEQPTEPPTVEPPSLSEQMNDDLPFKKGDRGKSGRKAPRSPSKMMPPV